MTIDASLIAKEAAGKAAAAIVESGMVVGLGTGTTAAFLIAHLGRRCQQGLKIKAVATSQQSLELALVSGIPMEDPNAVEQIDITIDGADEIDPMKRMIKGAGGALLREKIIAHMSREMVVIIDSKKQVQQLGQVPLPVEIVPFAYPGTMHQLSLLGFKSTLRRTKTGQPYVSENQNYLIQVTLPFPCDNPEVVNQQIRMIPGVVETGLFLNMAGRIFIGHEDGHVEIKS